MAEVAHAYVSLLPSAKGFGKGISSQIDGDLTSAGKSGGKKFGAALASTGKSAGRLLGGALLGGLGLAMVGIAAVVKTGVSEFMDASKGTAQLAAGIKSTGGAAGVTVKGLNDLASSIQAYSGQTDDSIVQSEALLLTFTKIKQNGPDKIFDRATAATANMAARMGGDASGAAIQLGKALNDPIKGLVGLSRAGVQFTDAQKASVKAMVEHGDMAGAQKLILAELETQFGGAAKAAGESMPGQLAKGKRAFEDLSQTLVTAAAPAIGSLSTKLTTDVIPALKSFADEFTNGTGTGGKFKDALTKVWDALVVGVEKVKDIVGWLQKHDTVTKALAVVVGTLTAAVLAYNIGVGVAAVATKAMSVAQGIWSVATGVATAAQWLLNAALTANPIGLVIVAIGALVLGIIAIATKTTWFQTIWKVMTDALGKAWQWLWNTILAPVIRFILNGFASITDGIGKMLGALGNIPGFGWAKVAADKMADAAGKARELAQGIKDIPDRKTVTVTYLEARAIHQAGPLLRASGGPVTAGQPYIVGERRPELFIPRVNGTIIPRVPDAVQSKSAAGPDLLAEIQGLRADIRRLPRDYQMGARQYA